MLKRYVVRQCEYGIFVDVKSLRYLSRLSARHTLHVDSSAESEFVFRPTGVAEIGVDEDLILLHEQMLLRNEFDAKVRSDGQ